MNTTFNLGLFLLLLVGCVAAFVLSAGLAMVFIGAIGHIFNVELFTQISLGESIVLSLVYGLLGFGAGSR